MTAGHNAWEAPPEERNERWIREQVEAVFGRDDAEEWMSRSNSHLDGRSPQQLLDAGEIDLLHAYIAGLLAGNYM